jgi:hypothetical protein
MIEADVGLRQELREALKAELRREDPSADNITDDDRAVILHSVSAPDPFARVLVSHPRLHLNLTPRKLFQRRGEQDLIDSAD